MRWEYKRQIVDVALSEIDEEPLDELGKGEWEIFSVVALEGNPKVHIAYAKRPIIEKKKENKELVEELIEQLNG